MTDGVKKDPARVSSELLPKIADGNQPDAKLVVYVWALGLTKEEGAGSAIIKLYGRSKSDLVRRNCLRALAMIGGKQNESFLLSSLEAAKDKEMRFDMLNLLGQMQCEAALPKTDELLKRDPKESFWQPIFVFGKMGDKAVPFLLKKIDDKDRNVRGNAISILGQWLIPTEATKPLQDRFWKEEDAELRAMILSSLERTISGFPQMKTFFEQVLAREKDEKVAQFARETIGGMDQMKTQVATAIQKKSPAPREDFQREYDALFESAGKKGSYDVLGAASTSQDEPKLKALRERILQRDSDEAFADYQKVNTIVVINRLTAGMQEQQAPTQP